MAALFSQAIVAFCVGTTPIQYQDACNHAVDAGSRQIGVRQRVDFAEDKTNEFVVNRAQYNLGKPFMYIAGAGGFLYRTAKSRTLSFYLPTFGLCNSLNNEFTPDSYKFTFEWKF